MIREKRACSIWTSKVRAEEHYSVRMRWRTIRVARPFSSTTSDSYRAVRARALNRPSRALVLGGARRAWRDHGGRFACSPLRHHACRRRRAHHPAVRSWRAVRAVTTPLTTHGPIAEWRFTCPLLPTDPQPAAEPGHQSATIAATPAHGSSCGASAAIRDLDRPLHARAPPRRRFLRVMLTRVRRAGAVPTPPSIPDLRRWLVLVAGDLASIVRSSRSVVCAPLSATALA